MRLGRTDSTESLTAWRPDHQVLRLSDSFDSAEGAVDVSCEVINVNWGHNREIAERCPALEGYSYFVERIRV